MGAWVGRSGGLARALFVAAGLLAAAASHAGWFEREKRQEAPAAAVVSLDHFLPLYDISQRNETTVKAPPPVTFTAARNLDLSRSAAVRLVLQSRKLLGGQGIELQRRPFLDQVHAMGWVLLAEVPGRAMVFGAVTRPWETSMKLRPIPRGQFSEFRERGWAKIIWTLEVDPAPEGRSTLRTRTRVATTDATARKQFKSYWSKIVPGVALVRQQALGLVKSDAEQRARQAARR
jgi:hypothetical protein